METDRSQVDKKIEQGMKIMKKKPYCLLFFGLIAFGCAKPANRPPSRAPSSEIQRLPTRKNKPKNRIKRPPTRTQIIIAQLRHEEPFIRKEAAKSLARLGPKAKKAAPLLISMLGDSNLKVRYYAAVALLEIGKGAVPALAKQLKTGHMSSKTRVAALLPHFLVDYDKGVSGLIQDCLQHPHPSIWMNTTLSFLRLGMWQKTGQAMGRSHFDLCLSVCCPPAHRQEEQKLLNVPDNLQATLRKRLRALSGAPNPKTRVSASCVLGELLTPRKRKHLITTVTELARKLSSSISITISSLRLLVRWCRADVAGNDCHESVLNAVLRAARKGPHKLRISALLWVAPLMSSLSSNSKKQPPHTSTKKFSLRKTAVRKVLLDAMNHRSHEIRGAALCTLGRTVFLGKTKPLRKIVNRLKKDPHPTVRLRAQAVCQSFGTKKPHQPHTPPLDHICPTH